MYPWIVFLHVIGAFGFVFCHGVSGFVAFTLLEERNLDRIQGLLVLSKRSAQAVYVFLVILLLAGIVAAFMGGFWGQGWIWVSLVLLIIITGVMFGAGTRFYAGVRKAAGLEYMLNGKPYPAEPPASAEEMDRILTGSPAHLLSGVGILGFLIILGLMYFKPF